MTKIRPVLLATLMVGLSLSLLSISASAAKSYYKWVDENGVTHYSARKPHDKESEVISVSTGLPRDSSGQPIQIDGGPENGNQQAAAEDEDPEANKDPERCEAAKKNLEIINQNARIREKTEDGSFRILTPDEKNERKATAQQIIDEAC